MAHSKSARKRIRQTEKRRMANKMQMNALRTQLKKARQALAAHDAERARAEYQATVQALDRAAGKGIIHANKAARHKSRLAQQLAQLAPSPQPAST